ncbi:Arylsulfatase [Pontiella desulfatans]|uniref:Arylsulfatase n=1 Tax=Pontiella desulfatans TaxID=2750659 RepID=A0A6C2U6M9_PONDE|nr:sulfatase [Pontiella desulfatans]SPS73979.1 sulfatase S1_19 [Kiritimatiellales bacterium]VGO15457.1 Arylsulfatase [Pontiella desulfatans]
MIRTLFATLLLAGTALAGTPNILLILADDLGYADLGVQGCTQFKTPNIDSIAKGGVRFKQGYVSNSVCAPSRAGLLSGRIGIGFEANLPEGEDGLDPSLETMAGMLKRAGYATSCIGKWHLGKLDKHYPTNRGFDGFCGLRGGSRSYFWDPKNNDKPNSVNRIELNGQQVEFEGYLTDFFTDKAIAILEANPPGQPFFMYLSYTAPHAPMHAKPEHIERYKDIKNPKRQIYAAMMHSLDENVGRVLQCLDERGLRNNTLVVFLSDNGGPTYKNGSDNGPLRDKKGSVWEGGVRVPFFIQWPGTIPAGQVRDDIVSSLDLVPTFAAAAGTEPVKEADGIDLLPYLTTADKTVDAQRMLLWRRDHMTDLALRHGTYKWIENRNRKETTLYDLEQDIGEKNNLAEQYPEIVERLRNQYIKWEASVPEPAFKSGWTPADEAASRREQEAYEKKQKTP